MVNDRSSARPRSAAKAKEPKPSFACSECGWTTGRWAGRCGECQAWGTLVEVGATTVRTGAGRVARPALPVNEVPTELTVHRQTGVAEFDRVLGGGLVPGAVILVAGEPGVGKSTLLLDVAGRAAAHGAKVLYVSGEESAAQIRLRAARIGAMDSRLLVADETDLGTVLAHIDAVKPDLLIVDSVQTIASGQIEGAAGNVAQVREVAAAVIAAAKSRSLPTLLVGHVTKDGSVAGPRTLEHLVDVVCQFEGERHARLRMVRAVKNRFGPTDEVGCFEMTEDGIVELPDPSGLFLSRIETLSPGSCVTVTLEGRRPLVVEVQSLVAPSTNQNARRTTSGLDGGRVAMIQAVLATQVRLPVHGVDLYASTVGGVRLSETAADLAVALAVASATTMTPLRQSTIAMGEVSLTGEIRAVSGVARRLTEAARLGFTRALVPPRTAPSGLSGIEVVEVEHVAEAVRLSVAGKFATAQSG